MKAPEPIIIAWRGQQLRVRHDDQHLSILAAWHDDPQCRRAGLGRGGLRRALTTTDAILELLEGAGLVKVYVDTHGKQAMRLTDDGVRVAADGDERGP